MQKSVFSRYLAFAAIALFSVTVSACGGGGGGGSTPPVAPPGAGGPPPTGSTPTPKPGNTPTPTPGITPTPTPGITPTPGPTATPVRTPTPMPTQTPTPAPPTTTSVTMLPDTTGRFGLTQILDWDGIASHQPLSPSQIESEAPHEDSVWGAFYPQYWNAAHPGMILSRYMLPVEDDYSISGHNLQWFQQYHPDWILYACSNDGTPTHDLAASGTGFGDVVLDFSNPAVISYQIGLMIPYLKANGYNAAGVDNTDLLNYLYGKSGGTSEYGCGTYDSSGTFHAVFGGPYGARDSAFISAMLSWVQQVHTALKNAGLKLIINHPLYNPVTNGNEQTMLANTDGMLYEEGFTNYGRYQSGTASLVSTALSWAQYAQAHHVAFLITDYLCYSGHQPFNNNAPCPTDPSQIPAPQVDWALATYALANTGGADVYISPQTGQFMSYRPEYSTQYGKACSAYTVANNLYVQKFQQALVVVNAGSSSATYTLPHAASQYRDIEGRPVGNPLSLAPADGYVLLTSNGCS